MALIYLSIGMLALCTWTKREYSRKVVEVVEYNLLQLDTNTLSRTKICMGRQNS